MYILQWYKHINNDAINIIAEAQHFKGFLYNWAQLFCCVSDSFNMSSVYRDCNETYA